MLQAVLWRSESSTQKTARRPDPPVRGIKARCEQIQTKTKYQWAHRWKTQLAWAAWITECLGLTLCRCIGHFFIFLEKFPYSQHPTSRNKWLAEPYQDKTLPHGCPGNPDAQFGKVSTSLLIVLQICSTDRCEGMVRHAS